MELSYLRHYFVYTMSERKIRTYKATDDAYKKALVEMNNKFTPLSTFLEQVVVAIAEGRKVVIYKQKK